MIQQKSFWVDYMLTFIGCNFLFNDLLHQTMDLGLPFHSCTFDDITMMSSGLGEILFFVYSFFFFFFWKKWNHVSNSNFASSNRGGGYSTLSWVRMCGLNFRPPPYNKTREDANLLPISKPFVSWRALFKTNQCFLQCKLGCISTFWQPIDKPKDKFIRNYAFCKNATYI